MESEYFQPFAYQRIFVNTIYWIVDDIVNNTKNIGGREHSNCIDPADLSVSKCWYEVQMLSVILLTVNCLIFYVSTMILLVRVLNGAHSLSKPLSKQNKALDLINNNIVLTDKFPVNR